MIRTQLAHYLIPVRAHFDRVMHRSGRLLFKRPGAAVPELGNIQTDVEHRGSVDITSRAMDANRVTRAVRSPLAQVMATCTGNAVVVRKTGIPEQPLAQSH